MPHFGCLYNTPWSPQATTPHVLRGATEPYHINNGVEYICVIYLR